MSKPRKTRPLSERLMAKVIKDASGCWQYTGKPNPVNGYCTIGDQSRQRPAHRVAYEIFVGPIPEGMEIDHLCHTMDQACPGGIECPHRRCVNPAHLEPVTRTENNRRSLSPSAVNQRKTHCAKGHEFSVENTIAKTIQTPSGPNPRRACRECELGWRAKRPPRRKGGPRPEFVGPVAPEELKTHCKNGHEFTPENTAVKPYWHGVGAHRVCRACAKEQKRAYNQRKKESGG